MNRNERLEAITTCVGMSDYLSETVKWNSQHFDEWIIGTTPSDDETREVCRKYNLKCILSDDVNTHGEGFNKGRLNDRLLQHTSANAFRLHIDADIAIPNGFRDSVQAAELHKDFIYGADRIDIFGWDKWQALLKSGFMNNHHDYHCRTRMSPEGFTIGDRWSSPTMGYCPIGFFQLWNSESDEWRGIRVKDYPSAHNTACRTDVQFAMQWDRTKRAVIPELVVAHLMSEKLPLGANWKGRKSKPFGPGTTTEKHHCHCYHDHDHHCHKHHHRHHHKGGK